MAFENTNAPNSVRDSFECSNSIACNNGVRDLFPLSNQSYYADTGIPREFGSAPTFYDSQQQRDPFALVKELLSEIYQQAFMYGFWSAMQNFGPKHDDNDKPKHDDNKDKPEQKPQPEQKPEPKPEPEPAPKTTSGKDILNLDFNNGKPTDKNLSRSIDDNKQNFGGSSIKYITTPEGRHVVNFSIDRWPDLPKGWEKNPPSNVSDAEIAKLKTNQSYRAELTSYQPDDQLKPGHTYDISFSNQIVKWDPDKSAWGDLFWQMHQSQPFGVPELGIGTQNNHFNVMIDGNWHKIEGMPPVDQMNGKWQDWKIRMKMPDEKNNGGEVEFYYNGKKVYEIPDWQLKHGFSHGDPYVKFGVYKAVYHQDDKSKYVATGGSRYREMNFDQFVMKDVSD